MKLFDIGAPTPSVDACIVRLACGSTGVGARLGSRPTTPGVEFPVRAAAATEEADEES